MDWIIIFSFLKKETLYLGENKEEKKRKDTKKRNNRFIHVKNKRA